MKVIERVARALALSHGSKIVGPGQSVATREVGWKGDGEYMDRYIAAHWKEHVHAAEFAIGALRHLSDGVDEAMSRHASNGMVDWRDIHTSLIEEILKEQYESPAPKN